MKVMNKAQVDALFQYETVLIGTADVVPDSRAAELFGEQAVEHALAFPGGEYWNAYGTQVGNLTYLTYSGFLAAASCCNVHLLREGVKA